MPLPRVNAYGYGNWAWLVFG